MSIMVSLWIILAIIYITQSPETKGSTYTNIGGRCNNGTCPTNREECNSIGYCQCDTFANVYEANNINCSRSYKSEGEDMIFITTPASKSHDIIDLMHMKGLQCGNESGGYNRRAHVDRLPEKCVEDVTMKFKGSGEFIKLDGGILHDKSQCNIKYTTLLESNCQSGCSISKSPLQISLNCSDWSPILNITNFGVDGNTLCYRQKNNTYVSKSVDSIDIEVSYYLHPECVVASSVVSAESCPSDLTIPVVQVGFDSGNTDVYLHGSAKLNCRFVSLTQVTGVAWLIDRTIISDEMLGYNISTNKERQFSTLTIVNVTPAHLGHYSCNVSNLNGNSNSCIRLDLKEEFPRPDLPNEFKVVTLGSDTMLTCTVPDAYPKIVMTWWEKNNIRLERSFEVHTVNNFSIQNVDPRDLGEYRCCANNTKGTNCSNQILLGALPFDVCVTQDNEALLGETLNITCSARALPDPVNLLLMKDGTIIHQNQSTVVDNSTSSDSKGGTKSYQFQLIQNVEIQQAVNYSCRAINNVGYSDSDIISIEVYGITFSNPTDISVTYGDSANLTCPIQFVNPQTSNVSWYLNDTCLNPVELLTILSPKNYQIISADFSNNGEYRCHVDNGKQNKRSDGFFVHVKGDYPSVASDIQYRNQEYSDFLSVNQSERVELICNITASPIAIHVIWIKDEDGNTKTFNSQVSSPNLVFDSVELGDAGNYTCNATNAVGSRTGNTITLQVNKTVPMCPCSCAFKAKFEYWKRRNLTTEELLNKMQPFMKEVLNDIKMDKSKISVVIRKLTSAPDDRKSAKQIGTLGVVLIVGAFVVIILFDILTCVRFYSRRNRITND